MSSGQRARLACWRARPRHRELSVCALDLPGIRVGRKDCFGADAKPARQTRALPGSETRRDPIRFNASIDHARR